MSQRPFTSAGELFQGGPGEWRRFVGLFAVIFLVMAALFIAWSGFYTVDAHEQAVVLRFGTYHVTRGPGIHFMIPLIDRAEIIETNEHSLRLPYGVTTTGKEDASRLSQARGDEPLILTADLYAAVVEWNVIWRVQEPKDYLFCMADEDIERAIVGVSRSVMSRIVGDYSAEEVLTGKREEIGMAAEVEMQRVFDEYGFGVAVVAVQMQRITPPDRVKPAFDEVNASIQERDRFINEANRERNAMIPKAQGEQDKLVREAEGYAARRQAEANGEISALLATYKAYQQAPEVTRRRLYLEALEDIIQNAGPVTVLDSDLKSLLPLLQLNEQGNEDPN